MTNSQLNHFICLSLPYAKALLQFRFQVDGKLDMTGIMDCLPSKIERVYLRCSNANDGFPTGKCIRSFVNERKHLKFLYIFIENLSEILHNIMYCNLKLFYKDSDKIIMLNDTLVNIEKFEFGVPCVYVYETMKFKSQVSVFNLFRFRWEHLKYKSV